MLSQDVRLKILEIVVPTATIAGVNKPENIVNICSQFEQYVLGSPKVEEKSASQPPIRKKRSSKKATDEPVPSFLDPAHSG